MAGREQSGFDGSRLLLVHHSPGWTRWFGLVAVLGLLISVACGWLTVWASGRGMGTAAVVAAFVGVVALVLCVPFVVAVAATPPALRITADGLRAAPDRNRGFDIPWSSVRSVGTASRDGRRALYVVHVDPAYWDRAGTRWFGEGERHWLPDVRDKIAVRPAGMDLAEALRVTRKLAPSSVPVDTLET
ncbi:MAG: hypothetical protein J2P24_07270 [Streptosporangiales bacterium]|nr:hypothetical protein [Streptosporangiales bacterium]